MRSFSWEISIVIQTTWKSHWNVTATYERLSTEQIYGQCHLVEGMVCLTTSDYGQTEQLLGELVKRYPNSFLVHQARYWQGRAAEKLGDISQAAMYYHQVLKRGPYTFYGYRAADRVASMQVLDTAMKAALSEDTDVLCKEGPCSNEPMHAYETDDGPPVWSEETRALLAAEPFFRKTLELLYVDMKKEAAVELWSLQEKIPRKLGATIGLSKAFFELGDYHRSYMLVTRKYERYLEAPQGGTPEDLWRLAYPQAYWDHIISHAKKYTRTHTLLPLSCGKRASSSRMLYLPQAHGV